MCKSERVRKLPGYTLLEGDDYAASRIRVTRITKSRLKDAYAQRPPYFPCTPLAHINRLFYSKKKKKKSRIRAEFTVRLFRLYSTERYNLPRARWFSSARESSRDANANMNSKEKGKERIVRRDLDLPLRLRLSKDMGDRMRQVEVGTGVRT